ncbi:hypothetical protein DRJ22_03045 [Candidatus Woesearchaeota archaeon]|nr:MAG: hypothetical protein DRJ22_03045 [Candidatus Woesearchaeota archaeon]
MHTVLEAEKETKKQADTIQEALNNNINTFQPDLLMEQIVKNYQITKKIYGPKLLKLLTDYEPEYIEKNKRIPEFKKELKENITKNIEKLREKKLIDKEGNISNKGKIFSTISLIKQLDKYITKETTGQKHTKKKGRYGEKGQTHKYKKGDRYRDLNARKTVRNAIKRKHTKIKKEDLEIYERQHKGKISIIIALDASASMKGKKIEECKKAGTALAYKAIKEKDKIGLIVFGSEIKEAIRPTNNFEQILQAINNIQASKQTDFTKMIQKATELFPAAKETKHLIIITDALPTKGKKPEQKTLQAISKARTAGITTSVIGIKLDTAGQKLAKQMTSIGKGRLSIAKKIDNLGNIILEEYHMIKT